MAGNSPRIGAGDSCQMQIEQACEMTLLRSSFVDFDTLAACNSGKLL